MTVKVMEAETGLGKTILPAASPYICDSDDPRDFHLPSSHDAWRPYQKEALLWATDGTPQRVISLVQTKSLQKHQYDEEYGFDAHYGRANYDCIHPSAKPGTTCDRCLHLNNGGMSTCPVSGSCPYLLSKHAAMNSSKASLNYAYWMSAVNWRKHFPPEILFCDEAHNLSKIVLNWVGTTIIEHERNVWDLPTFPSLDSSRGSGILIKREPPTDSALSWLEKASSIMFDHCNRLSAIDDEDKYDKAEDLLRRIDNTLSSLRECSDDWFILSGYNVREYKGEMGPAFMCKPLSARHHAQSYFMSTRFNTVMMSATIGNPEIFAKELGIDEYEFKSIPSRWVPESRPIYVLSDVPKMGYVKGESQRARDNRFDKQADEIARFLKEFPKEWPGLIHVTRKAEEVQLTERLAKRGLESRIWCIPGKVDAYIATDHQVSMWKRRLKKVPNSILVTCSLDEGYDGRDEKINISAKVPYPPVGRRGSYEYAWMVHNKSRYDQSAATTLAQQMGRNRRGRACDYDVPGEPRGANAVADGSFGRIRNKLPVSIQEAIVER